jgi:transcriptional regulator with XRE-family HTH domain
MKQPDAAALGRRIRAARLERGLTQDQIAAGRFSKAYMSAVELGRIRPSVSALSYIATQLELSPANLLDDSSEGLGEHRNQLLIADVLYQLCCRDYAAARASLEQVEQNILYSPDREQLSLLEAELCLEEGDPIRAQQILFALNAAQRTRLAPNLAAYADYLAARASLMRGQSATAAEFAAHALTILRESGSRDLHLELATLVALMQALAETNPEAALALQPQIARLSEQASDASQTAVRYYQMAMSERRNGTRSDAQQYLHYALGLAELAANSGAAQAAASNLAAQCRAQGNNETAARYLAEALRYAKLSRNPAAIASAAARLASFQLEAGKTVEAEQSLAEAEAWQDRVGDELAGEILLVRARVLVATGERSAAERTFQEAIARLTRTHAREKLGEAYFRYAQALGSWGRIDESARYLQLAYAQTNPPE